MIQFHIMQKYNHPCKLRGTLNDERDKTHNKKEKSIITKRRRCNVMQGHEEDIRTSLRRELEQTFSKFPSFFSIDMSEASSLQNTIYIVL